MSEQEKAALISKIASTTQKNHQKAVTHKKLLQLLKTHPLAEITSTSQQKHVLPFKKKKIRKTKANLNPKKTEKNK